MIHPLLAACFLSGAAGLVYQVVWMRRLSLLLGASSLAVGAVLALFMGGLAAGASYLGRAADRADRPLRFYALLELGIAALGLLSLPLTVPAPGPAALDWIRAAAAVFLPAALMGGTVPALLRAAPGRAGRAFGALYAVNTLGAACGSLACAFFLVERWGLLGAALFAAGLNLAAAALAVLTPEPARLVRDSSAPARGSRAEALWAAALAGFAGMALEVLWTRYIVLALHASSVFAFGVVLAVFLLGIVLGSAACALPGATERALRRALGASLVLGGAGACATLLPLAGLAARPAAGDGFWSAQVAAFLRAAFSRAPAAASLEAVGFPGAEALAALLLAGPAELRALAGEGPLTTDDRPRVEYLRRRPGLRAAGSAEPETWELLAALPEPDWAAVFPGFGAADRERVLAERRALTRLFARRVARRDYPDAGAASAEQARTLEAQSRVVARETWELLAHPGARVFRMMLGLERPEPHGAPPAARAAYDAAMAHALEDWREGRLAEAKGHFAALARAARGGLRPALLSAACSERMGEPLTALRELLALDLPRHLPAPELSALPHRLVDRVLSLMEARPEGADALGRGLLELLPPGDGRPEAVEAGDLPRWRAWWSSARHRLRAGPGGFEPG